MDKETGPLGALGLTPVQHRVYETLALAGEGRVSALADKSGLSARETATALDELVRLGLAMRHLGSHGYAATPVEPALDALAHARREEIARAEAFARRLAQRAAQEAQRHSPDQLVSVVSGAEAIRAIHMQMQRAAEREVRVLDRPPYVTAVAAGGTGADPLQTERMAAGVTYRTIYDQGLFDDPASLARVRREIASGESGRVLTDLPLKLIVTDQTLAMVPLLEPGPDEEPAALVVRPSVLLDSLVALFEALWQMAKPVRARAAADDGEEIRRFVELLATGLTEDRLARLLGISERTVRRRLSEAREELGATTMFQAGVEAARRGWL